LTLSENNTSGELTATWQVIHANNFCAPRAYHSATLIAQRYLVVIGGMSGAGSIRNESILDTQSWTWINSDSVTEAWFQLSKPTGRHGHSAVWDEKRDRIVVFGGGNGTDLLRSGMDNAEVWELRMGPVCRNADPNVQEIMASLPWKWAQLLMNEGGDHVEDVDEDGVHQQRMIDTLNDDVDDNNDDDDREMARPVGNVQDIVEDDDVQSAQSDEDSDNPPPLVRRADDSSEESGDAARGRNNASRQIAGNLSDVEKLCLGRCHLGFKVGPDTVVFAFGSGRPSTNGVLGFNLMTNSFIRTQQAKGSKLPPPRFSCAGVVFGEYNSYMLVHGGYSTQEGRAIGNMAILDLAPAVRRPFTALPNNTELQGYPPVRQEDVSRHSMFGGHHFGFAGHGMGIDRMEDLMQNIFVAAGGPPDVVEGAIRGRMERGGAEILGGGRNLGELLRFLAGRGRPPADDNDDDDDDGDGDESESLGDILLEEAPTMLLNMVMGEEESFDAEDDEEEEDDDDDESTYDRPDLSEVS
jgi:hypothetical protein